MISVRAAQLRGAPLWPPGVNRRTLADRWPAFTGGATGASPETEDMNVPGERVVSVPAGVWLVARNKAGLSGPVCPCVSDDARFLWRLLCDDHFWVVCWLT